RFRCDESLRIQGLFGARAMTHDHQLDEQGNPAGGTTRADGIAIDWHNGRVDTGEPNGATIETAFEAVAGRLRFFQDHPELNCKENAQALRHIGMALQAL